MKLLAIALVAAACGCAQPRKGALHGSSGHGGTLVVVIEDRLAGSFRQDRWQLLVDGRVVSACEAGGELEGPIAPVVAHEDYLSAGPHKLSVLFRHRGHGSGVFAYLKGYTFQTRSEHEVQIGPTGLLTVRVIGYERGGPTTPLEERPAVRFESSAQVPDPLLPRGCRSLSR